VQATVSLPLLHPTGKFISSQSPCDKDANLSSSEGPPVLYSATINPCVKLHHHNTNSAIKRNHIIVGCRSILDFVCYTRKKSPMPLLQAPNAISSTTRNVSITRSIFEKRQIVTSFVKLEILSLFCGSDRTSYVLSVSTARSDAIRGDIL
jgi:hypothetical protein